MDCFLYNPPANWIVSYKIHLQMVNWIVYMIYFMSRQQLGAYFPAKKGRFKSKMAARGINNVNDALEPNRIFFCGNIAILRCNVAILMCKLLGAHWSNFALVFNVYYKIKGKFVPQACNICIFHF